jgi:hypothetical protein
MVGQNSERAASGRRRGPGRPFKKGVSGNPGGRPTAALRVQEMARRKTPEALEALIAALSNPRERVQAAVALLDRGWGKPVQMVAADAEKPLQISFEWQDSPPAAHTDTRAVRHIGEQIEAQLIEAAIVGTDKRER